MRFAHRISVAVATGGVFALAAAMILATSGHGGESRGGGGPPVLSAQVAAGMAIYTVGMCIAVIRSAWIPGLLLAAAGPALFLAALPLPGGNAVLFTAALAGGSASAVIVAAGVLLYVRSPQPVLDAVAAGAALAVAVFWLGLFPAAAYDPLRAGCFECPRNLLLVHAAPGFYDALVRTGLYAGAATCAILSLLTIVRCVLLDRAVLRVVAPVLLGGAASAGVASATFAYEARVGFPLIDPTTRTLWLAQCGILALIALGIASELVRARYLSHRIASMVVGAFPSAQELRVALATSAGDAELSVVFPQEDGTVLDGEGRAVEASDGRWSLTNIVRAGETVAQLRHSDTLAHAPERVAEAARAAGLALEYASSRARLRAQVAELRASRARIVEVSDTERRRLERDLHDGAQQRLIAVLVALQRPDRNGPTVTRARDEIVVALEELRALAHGIHPAALTDAGLEAALRELADSSGVPIRFDTVQSIRVPPTDAIAVYRVVLEGVRCAERGGDGRPVTVRLEHSHNTLRAQVTLPGVDTDTARLGLEHAFDRVAALDGDADIRSDPDGARVEVKLSCES